MSEGRLIFVYAILAMEKLRRHSVKYSSLYSGSGPHLHSCDLQVVWDVIVASCPKPDFKHKDINFVYSLHCTEHFNKTVNCGPDLQLMVDEHSPLTSMKMHLSILSEALLKCV